MQKKVIWPCLQFFIFLDLKVCLCFNVFLPQNVLAPPLSSWSHWLLLNSYTILFFDFISITFSICHVLLTQQLPVRYKCVTTDIYWFAEGNPGRLLRRDPIHFSLQLTNNSPFISFVRLILMETQNGKVKFYNTDFKDLWYRTRQWKS